MTLITMPTGNDLVQVYATATVPPGATLAIINRAGAMIAMTRSASGGAVEVSALTSESDRPFEVKVYAPSLSGFRYRLYSDEWEELGEFTTAVPNWAQGEEFTTGDGRQFRILGIVPVADDVGIYNALWRVEPVND